MSLHPLYHTWRNMVRRCHDPRFPDYQRFGARGVTVCERWRKSLADFVADVGPRPAGMTLDRIDRLAGYSPDNVRWATHTTQANNRSSNVRLSIAGEEHTVMEWARLRGLRVGVIYLRLERGWSPERSVNTPVRAYRSVTA